MKSNKKDKNKTNIKVIFHVRKFRRANISMSKTRKASDKKRIELE